MSPAPFNAALPIQRWIAIPGRWRAIGIATVAVLVALGAARVVRGIVLRPNAEYWAVVEWVDANVPHDSPALVSPAIGLSLPLQSYDFFRLLNPYVGPSVTLASVVEHLDIRFLILDSEWREYATTEMGQFIATRCEQRTAIGGTTVYEVRWP